MVVFQEGCECDAGCSNYVRQFSVVQRSIVIQHGELQLSISQVILEILRVVGLDDVPVVPYRVATGMRVRVVVCTSKVVVNEAIATGTHTTSLTYVYHELPLLTYFDFAVQLPVVQMLKLFQVINKWESHPHYEVQSSCCFTVEVDGTAAVDHRSNVLLRLNKE